MGARAQKQTPADHLKAAISHIEAGDFLLAVLTLNEITSPAARADASMIAKAHVYRAQAFLGLNNQERARSAAALAVDAQPDIEVSAPPFSPAVVSLFDEVRRTAALDPEAAGNVAEKSGRFEEAFRAYLRAYQALPEPASAEDDRRLRERIIDMSLALPVDPPIPQDAKEHFAKATQLLEAEAALGGSAASSQAAAAELRSAIRLAPWWPEATFKLAGVLQKLQRVDEALMNLNLYRVADPVGYAAAISKKPAVATPVRESRTATVHIYWPPQQRGGGRPKVYCDGFHIADLQNEHFVVFDVKPGAHEIRFHNAKATVSFDEGRNYYLRVSAEGFPVHAVLRQVTPEEGAAEIRDEDVTSNDPRRTYANECAAPAPARKGKG